MTDQEIIDLVDTSLCDEFELERGKMTPDANLFEDLGLDSLDIVDMVVVLETAFKFKIREEDGIRDIRTLGDIHGFVIARQHALEKEQT